MTKPDYMDFASYRDGAISVAALPQDPTMRAERKGPYRTLLKPSLDFLTTLLFLPIILPVIGILALMISLDGSNPFYVQKRIGRNGRIFNMWKLRTMVPDAEERLDAYLATSDEIRTEWEIKQKLAEDPRITPMGRLLRRTSMDELPQFFNVLTGDMSVVGPRPMMAGQEDLYPGRSYYDLRPGLTGPWQVSDRNASSFADRARFDDIYLREVSPLTDLRMVLSTIKVVLRGTGC